jgi:hypothetical protein
MKANYFTVAAAGALLAFSGAAQAFCGFYVGKADASLFNDASKVVMVRDGDRTTISMLNDYQGDLKEFAMVVPVPVVLQKEDVKTPFRALFDRIDAYSAPRLAEYFDPDPCLPRRPASIAGMASSAPQAEMRMAKERQRDDLGVRIEAQYTVGPYDIVILSAEQSDGLETWLTQNGYRIPKGASKALAPYIRQNLKFFVARVNLEEQAKSGAEYLAPLQFSFKTEKFMLPIRLGMVNARGPQDLVLWVLTKNGRVEATNYRTVKLPANMELPPYIKADKEHAFAPFYRALFDEQSRREGYRVVFTEYFWDMSWCDPCAANPLSAQELKNLGADWVAGDTRQGAKVMLTRLHVRYTPETFPEDLAFQETSDRQNYQARYVLRHAAKIEPDACPAARDYLLNVAARKEKEAQDLASLTGWEVGQIRAKSGLTLGDTGFWGRFWRWLSTAPAPAAAKGGGAQISR